MDIQNREKQAWMRLVTALLLCAVFLFLVVGSALARYENSRSEEVSLKYEAKTDQIYVESVANSEGMEISEDSYAMTFEISNGTSENAFCEYDQTATLSVFATLGLQNPDNFTITLTEGGQTFEAVCIKTVEGSNLYSEKGAGWVYRFYNAAGEELSWNFSGGQLCSRRMTLTIKGTSELPTALSLIADAKPGKNTASTGTVSIQLAQPETSVPIDSNFLSEDGMEILLTEDFSELVIPITIFCEDLKQAGSIGTTGVIKAVSSDETKMTVALDTEEIVLTEDITTVNLTIQKTEEVDAENEIMLQEVDILMVSASENGSESEKEITPEADSETEKETVPEIDSETEEETIPETGGETEEEIVPETGGETEEEKTPETDSEVEEETTTETDSETEKETETESVTPELSVKVTLSVGEKEYSAIIKVVEEKENDTWAGELQFCQSQYDPTEPVILVNGEDAECSIGTFPAMTKYILEGKTFLLYNGGNITLPAGKEVKIDLSLTETAEDLEISIGEEKNHTIKYVELPEFPQDVSPLIMDENGSSFKMNKAWGNIEPEITVEHLTKEEDEVVWKTVETVMVKLDEEGKVKLKPDEARAGTYQLIVSWIENEILLYQMKIPFFIQYQSVSQGGTE